MADQFIAHMLARHVRIERDLIDSLFNSCEKRLARTLLRLARYGQRGQPRRALPQLSLDALAEMADTTLGTANRFLKKFKKLEFIEGDGAFKVNSTLLRVVLRE
jgi:CRP/FNR family cyclic AMP-dependent transcriptional regulator